MEVGKYISLGAGIQVRKSSNDTYTYYHNFRIGKKVKRKKLFVKKKHTSANFKEAVLRCDTAKKEEEKRENTIILNELALLYFKSREDKQRGILKQDYNHLSYSEFEEHKVIKKKMANLKAEHQRYNKNVRDSKLAKLDLSVMKREDIKEYIDGYLQDKRLAQKSVFMVVSLIKTIINYAIRNDIIDILNPFQNIKMINPKRKRVRYLNIDELTLLLDKCKDYEQNPNVYLTVYLALLTAARKQMILNIKKKDIDIENKKIRLMNFKSNKHYLINLNQESVDWLDKKVLQHIGPNDYLIQPVNQRDKKIPQEPLSDAPEKIFQIMDELFNSHLDKSINNDRDFVVNFHTIRRSVATNLALQGTQIYDIMILLNHTTTKQTQDYLNLDNESLGKETNRLFASIFKDS